MHSFLLLLHCNVCMYIYILTYIYILEVAKNKEIKIMRRLYNKQI